MAMTTRRKQTQARREFANEALLDFSLPANADAQRAALREVAAQLGRTYPIIINGERITPGKTFNSINPADPSQIVGVFASATPEVADRAVAAAHAAFQTWQYVSAEERASYLFKAADLMCQRRFIFNAWLIYEVGKNWAEADADTAEAIDFLTFYALDALRLAEPQPLTPILGEANELRYIPLGVGAVIPPWNFANAIMAGLTASAIVAGNTVILKPASTAPTIAAQFVSLLAEVGLPKGVLNFLPGPGGTMGDSLVAHPLTRFISFTGSKEVGLHIHELAAKTQPGQKWIKRTVLEMGGKDSIIVDETADLDEAAKAIVASAFGFQGQKCSACSRAIIVNSIYDALLEKVLARTKALTIGPAHENSHDQNAVIDANAERKILEYIEIGKGEGRLVAGGAKPKGAKGYFIQPTIFADVAPTARLAQEEIFGPVLAVIRARDFEEALAIGNNTEFGLTGSLFSTDRSRIERAAREFHVGNPYFNRKCTGALVGVHPFGGFNMSGTDSKAGGHDYLLLFTQAKLMSEKL
jgi:1-pyrroline-5-carboxylate dehydrogenase